MYIGDRTSAKPFKRFAMYRKNGTPSPEEGANALESKRDEVLYRVLVIVPSALRSRDRSVRSAAWGHRLLSDEGPLHPGGWRSYTAGRHDCIILGGGAD